MPACLLTHILTYSTESYSTGSPVEEEAPEEVRSMVRPIARSESRMRPKGGLFFGSASQHTLGA